MNTSPALDNAIALLLASHAAYQEEREAAERTTVILRGDVTNVVPEVKAILTDMGFGKVFAPKAEKKAPIHKTEKAKVVKQDTTKLKSSHGEAYDPVGTLDAAGFFSAIRMAGKRRNDKGIMVFLGIKDGEDLVAKDKRCAIAGYIGYNSFELLGEQELRASAQANRELGITKLTGPMPKEVYREMRRAEGTTFGMPDHIAKRLADLKGQRRALVDVIASLEASASVILNARNQAKHDGKYDIMARAQELLTAKEGEVLVQRALLDACEDSIAACR